MQNPIHQLNLCLWLYLSPDELHHLKPKVLNGLEIRRLRRGVPPVIVKKFLPQPRRVLRVVVLHKSMPVWNTSSIKGRKILSRICTNNGAFMQTAASLVKLTLAGRERVWSTTYTRVVQTELYQSPYAMAWFKWVPPPTLALWYRRIRTCGQHSRLVARFMHTLVTRNALHEDRRASNAAVESVVLLHQPNGQRLATKYVGEMVTRQVYSTYNRIDVFLAIELLCRVTFQEREISQTRAICALTVEIGVRRSSRTACVALYPGLPWQCIEPMCEKSGRSGRSCDVMMTCAHYLGHGLKSPPIRPRSLRCSKLVTKRNLWQIFECLVLKYYTKLLKIWDVHY